MTNTAVFITLLVGFGTILIGGISTLIALFKMVRKADKDAEARTTKLRTEVVPPLNALSEGYARLETQVKTLADGQTALREGMEAKFANLSEGQTTLREGFARLEAQVKTLADGQTELQKGQKELQGGLTELDKRLAKVEDGQAQLEKGLTKVEEGQEELRNQWIKAETRLNHLDVAMGTLEGKTNTFYNVLNKCVTGIARTEGLVRGYFVKEDPRLLDPEYPPEAPAP